MATNLSTGNIGVKNAAYQAQAPKVEQPAKVYPAGWLSGVGSGSANVSESGAISTGNASVKGEAEYSTKPSMVMERDSSGMPYWREQTPQEIAAGGQRQVVQSGGPVRTGSVEMLQLGGGASMPVSAAYAAKARSAFEELVRPGSQARQIELQIAAEQQAGLIRVSSPQQKSMLFLPSQVSTTKGFNAVEALQNKGNASGAILGDIYLNTSGGLIKVRNVATGNETETAAQGMGIVPVFKVASVKENFLTTGGSEIITTFDIAGYQTAPGKRITAESIAPALLNKTTESAGNEITELNNYFVSLGKKTPLTKTTTTTGYPLAGISEQLQQISQGGETTRYFEIHNPFAELMRGTGNPLGTETTSVVSAEGQRRVIDSAGMRWQAVIDELSAVNSQIPASNEQFKSLSLARQLDLFAQAAVAGTKAAAYPVNEALRSYGLMVDVGIGNPITKENGLLLQSLPQKMQAALRPILFTAAYVAPVLIPGVGEVMLLPLAAGAGGQALKLAHAPLETLGGYLQGTLNAASWIASNPRTAGLMALSGLATLKAPELWKAASNARINLAYNFLKEGQSYDSITMYEGQLFGKRLNFKFLTGQISKGLRKVYVDDITAYPDVMTTPKSLGYSPQLRLGTDLEFSPTPQIPQTFWIKPDTYTRGILTRAGEIVDVDVSSRFFNSPQSRLVGGSISLADINRLRFPAAQVAANEAGDIRRIVEFMPQARSLIGDLTNEQSGVVANALAKDLSFLQLRMQSEFGLLGPNLNAEPVIGPSQMKTIFIAGAEKDLYALLGKRVLPNGLDNQAARFEAEMQSVLPRTYEANPLRKKEVELMRFGNMQTFFDNQAKLSRLLKLQVKKISNERQSRLYELEPQQLNLHIGEAGPKYRLNTIKIKRITSSGAATGQKLAPLKTKQLTQDEIERLGGGLNRLFKDLEPRPRIVPAAYKPGIDELNGLIEAYSPYGYAGQARSPLDNLPKDREGKLRELSEKLNKLFTENSPVLSAGGRAGVNNPVLSGGRFGNKPRLRYVGPETGYMPVTMNDLAAGQGNVQRGAQGAAQALGLAQMAALAARQHELQRSLNALGQKQNLRQEQRQNTEQRQKQDAITAQSSGSVLAQDLALVQEQQQILKELTTLRTSRREDNISKKRIVISLPNGQNTKGRKQPKQARLRGTEHIAKVLSGKQFLFKGLKKINIKLRG